MSRRPVDQGEAVHEERGGERTEQEVLQRTLGRARARAAERGHRVRADAHRLQPEEERQRVAGGGEHHRAERREQEERVELAALDAVLAQVPAGQQRRHRAAEADQHVEEERESVEDQPGRD